MQYFKPFSNLGHFSFILLSSVILGSCSSKQEVHSVQLSSNRTMAVGLRTLKVKDANAAKGFAEKVLSLTKDGIKKVYDPKLVDLDLSKDALIESPDNLYQIAIKEADDVFIADAEVTDSGLEVNYTVLNGSNLKTVNIFKVNSAFEPSDKFESTFVETFKKSAASAFPNPNIYPKSDPQHFADLLYVLSKKLESDNEQGLTCENAHHVLQFYEKTESLYKLANQKGPSKIVGQQQDIAQLNSRLQESSERVKVLKDCDAESRTSFALIVDFGKIADSSRIFVTKAIEKAGLEDLLKKYTDKPVKFHFAVEDGGNLNLNVDLRFDRQRYLNWIAKRIPMKYKTWQILSLDPYYALMQKLVVMTSSLPAEAPVPLKSAFATMKMNLTLSTLLNGEVYFPVSGKYYADKKAVQMAYPNSIYLTVPGYENRLVTTKDKELFQEKGWLSLGSCKGLDGSLTEDGLVYRFFGFPCN